MKVDKNDRQLDEPNLPDSHKDKGLEEHSDKPEKNKKDRELDAPIDESTKDE